MSVVRLATHPGFLAAMATAAKVSGTIPRLRDVRQAPGDIRRNAWVREGVLLSSTFASNVGTQVAVKKLLPKAFPALSKANPEAAAMMTVIQLAVAPFATYAAEMFSRKIGKPVDWNKLTNPSAAAPNREHSQKVASPDDAPAPQLAGAGMKIPTGFGTRMQAPGPIPPAVQPASPLSAASFFPAATPRATASNPFLASALPTPQRPAVGV